MQKILLPTDFSDNALNAIKYASKLFEKEQCVFYLLNTYTPMIYNYDYQMNSGGYFGDVIDSTKKNSINELEKIQKKFKKTNHTFKIVSAFNLLTDEITNLVNEHKIDLIVMGTKGATGVTKVLFGSNTIHVFNKAKCPVMAIPENHSFKKLKEILFPTDYQIDYSKKQLKIIKTIIAIFKSKIHILKVLHSKKLTSTENTNKHKLEKLLFNNLYDFHLVKNQTIPLAINEFQKFTEVQLLMMINNKQSFFENLFFQPIINQIGFNLKIPFLVIPTKM